MFYPESSQDPSPLDVGQSLKAYVDATAEFRKSAKLFIISNGAWKGLRASSRVIASWLVKIISLAYKTKGLSLPEGVTAHSTRGVSTSWAAAGLVSLETICKAATWSSIHTFMSHYCIEPAALTTVDFGRGVLASASSQS